MAYIPENTLKHMRNKAGIWHFSSKIWGWVHLSINIIGITMSCLSASSVAEKATPYFSVIAAICFGINGFANPQKQSNRNVRGYLILDDAILRAEDGLITIEELHNARGKAELEVHGTSEPTPPHSALPDIKGQSAK